MEKSSKSLIWIIAAIVILAVAFYVMSVNRDSSPQYPEGLNVTVLEKGSGEPIENGQTAVVHYAGTFDDGTVFDSSVERGQEFRFIVGAGRVIKGWDLGVLGMKVGEKRRLVIDPELAYGASGAGPIPPNSRLTFEVELLGID